MAACAHLFSSPLQHPEIFLRSEVTRTASAPLLPTAPLNSCLTEHVRSVEEKGAFAKRLVRTRKIYFENSIGGHVILSSSGQGSRISPQVQQAAAPRLACGAQPIGKREGGGEKNTRKLMED
jgi:hypothetical protein